MVARATVIYDAFQLRVLCEFPLPLLSVEGRPDVEVRARRVDIESVVFAPVDGVEDADAVWIDLGWCPDRIVLRFPDLVAELSLVEPIIYIDASASDDHDWIAHVVLDHVIPRWLALRGDLVLHAGAVVSPRGSAVAFVGDTGRGKSSTVTALAQAGWKLLGDDACRLVRSQHGWLATPSYPGVRLVDDSREVLTPGTDSTPMAAGANKHRVFPDVPVATSSVPLGLIVALGHDSGDAAILRLSLSEATAALARHSFHLAPTLAQVAPRAFVAASEVAAVVPCMRLDFRRTWDVFPDVIAALESVEAMAP